MIQPSMERTATAPVEVRVSEVVVVATGLEDLTFTESAAGGSMSISVEAMIEGGILGLEVGAD